MISRVIMLRDWDCCALCFAPIGMSRWLTPQPNHTPCSYAYVCTRTHRQRHLSTDGDIRAYTHPDCTHTHTQTEPTSCKHHVPCCSISCSLCVCNHCLAILNRRGRAGSAVAKMHPWSATAQLNCKQRSPILKSTSPQSTQILTTAHCSV